MRVREVNIYLCVLDMNIESILPRLLTEFVLYLVVVTGNTRYIRLFFKDVLPKIYLHYFWVSTVNSYCMYAMSISNIQVHYRTRIR